MPPQQKINNKKHILVWVLLIDKADQNIHKKIEMKPKWEKKEQNECLSNEKLKLKGGVRILLCVLVPK